MTASAADEQRPTATIIVGVRNAGDSAPLLASRLVDAVRRPGVDAVVVDDGSADDTGAVLAASFGDEPGITLIRHEESVGIAVRRNEALRVARGEVIWFVDHDDEWSVAGLDTLMRAIGDADIVFARADFAWGPGPGDRRLIDGVGGWSTPRTISTGSAAELMIGSTIHGYLWSKLFRRSTLGVDPFPALVSQSDVVGVARAVASARSVRVIPDIVYVYRRQPGSITRTRTPDLAALKSAHDGVLVELGGYVQPDERDVFTARFLCLAAVKTAVRWGVAGSAMRHTYRSAQEWARPLSLRAIFRRSKSLGGSILILKVAPSLLPAALRTALKALDTLRALRSRTRVGAEAE
ncbi:glycosyltransferase family 2 protein [Leifsonia sp. McL0607]|uniref:glycosyltransferase family 2 protein n=1 Tax=Leifsonia sp. McL0607 TaxID=3415672 RepID=UPI003CF69F2C